MSLPAGRNHEGEPMTVVDHPLHELVWGIKRIDPNLTTGRGREDADVIRWPVQTGGWVTHPTANHDDHSGAACGVGLHLARTWEAASLGGCLTSALCVIVGWHPDDVLDGDGDKVRVARCYVVAGAVDEFTSVAKAQGWDANLQGANLWYADLRYANLRYANLWYADLRYANLWYADLRGADLRDANLWDADLRGANLEGANLRYANLRYTNLRYANLEGADLRGADLRDADLRDADLRGANLEGANLRFADLRGATGGAYTVWPDGFDHVAAGVILR